MAEVRHKGRIALLAVAILIVFTGVSVRVAFLHLKPADWIVKLSDKGRMLEQAPRASRGRILDRNGEILAMDKSAYHVYVDPDYIGRAGDAELVARYLSDEFGIPESVILDKLANTNVQYRVIQKYVPLNQLTRFRRGRWCQLYTPRDAAKGDAEIVLRGVGLEEAPIRNYPKGPLMAHVVGFANLEGKGSAGIEYRLNQFLCGQAGHRVSRKDANANEIYGTRTIDIAPEDGANVVLTLDQQLQYKVEQVIEKMCREYRAKAGWAIVQHVRTGEILAMASFPTYDLNRYGKAPEEWRRNCTISTVYEPGSTMKAAVVAAALDHGIVTTNEMIDCENGHWVYGGTKLDDSHGEGVISVADVIQKSSNIGAAKIALKMGNQLLYDSLKEFHFGKKFGVGLPGEENGIFYSPRHWSKISPTRIGMGHEISVTALQVLSMMSTIAYNGVQMKPMLVKKILAPDGAIIEEFQPQKLGAPIRPRTARLMQELLHRVTEEGGTGTKARVEGYSVAGKTGTAQKINPDGGYFKKNFTSSFAGFLPVENPQLAIIVVADDPGKFTESGRKIGYFGGTVCGPAFSEIAEFAVRYFGIAPDGERVYVARPES